MSKIRAKITLRDTRLAHRIMLCLALLFGYSITCPVQDNDLW